MKMHDDDVFRIRVNIPEDLLEEMMDSVNSAMEPVFKGYDRAFEYSRVKGTWRALRGSSPFRGNIDETEVADEIRLEFVARGKDVKNIVNTIVSLHPYEEPAIDITPTYLWRDVV